LLVRLFGAYLPIFVQQRSAEMNAVRRTVIQSKSKKSDKVLQHSKVWAVSVYIT